MHDLVPQLPSCVQAGWVSEHPELPLPASYDWLHDFKLKSFVAMPRKAWKNYTYCVGTTREKREFNYFRFCSFLRKIVLQGSDQPCQFLKSFIRLGFHSHQTMIIWHKKLGKNYSFGAFVRFVHFLWFDQLTRAFVHCTDDVHKVQTGSSQDWVTLLSLCINDTGTRV